MKTRYKIINFFFFTVLILTIYFKWYGNSSILKVVILILMVSMVLKYSENVILNLFVKISRIKKG